MGYPTVKRVEGLGGLKAQNGSFLLKTVKKGDKTVQNNKKPLFSGLSQPPGIAPGRASFCSKHTEKERSLAGIDGIQQ